MLVPSDSDSIPLVKTCDLNPRGDCKECCANSIIHDRFILERFTRTIEFDPSSSVVR